MRTVKCVALLGRADHPTDAVHEYCEYLREALRLQGISLEIERVKWNEAGWWRGSRQWLRDRAKEIDWFVVQYTALAWSRRGFPLRFLGLLRDLKRTGARIAVIFHDGGPTTSARLIDRIRRSMQLHVMRRAVKMANLAVLTIPVEKASWLPADSHNVAFIPVGANLPNAESAWQVKKLPTRDSFAIAVFGVTGGLRGQVESEDIASAMRYAAERVGPLHLSLIGRHTECFEPLIGQKLAGAPVGLRVYGLSAPEKVVEVLGAADVLLFVRGAISTRRGSAIAGIACGLPIVAREGSETDATIREAGVVLLPADWRDGYGPALVRVLSDPVYRESLAEKSRRAQSQYFSWARIAERYAEALSGKL
jgi:glycosyltransferase involved in cell wall biosynthesis